MAHGWEMVFLSLITIESEKIPPMTMNIPYGFFGYSTSGKNSGASLNDRATFVGW